MAQYTLMHQDIAVADMVLNRRGGIESIITVHQLERIPIGATSFSGAVDCQKLDVWWANRRIPISRDGIRDVFSDKGITDLAKLAIDSWGLSLSDHYWVKPKGASLAWKKINFFENDFSEDVGNLLMGKKMEGNLDLISPDNTSDGWLKKKWKIIDGKRCLLKAGSQPFYQEPYNEVIASFIMTKLGIMHTPYLLFLEDDQAYSVCENFTTCQVELVTAWYVMQTEKQENHISTYQHYLNCCGKYDIPNLVEEIDKMIVVDFLIANEDRHQNNFGLLRDVKTLKFIGVAPIYDSGSSLFFSQATEYMGATRDLKCKPFKTRHESQIKLVQSFDWLDLSKLDGIEYEIRDLCCDAKYISSQRREEMIRILKGRILKLQQLIAAKTNETFVDDIADDVKLNKAYSGN